MRQSQSLFWKLPVRTLTNKTTDYSSFEIAPVAQPTTTPLLEHLRSQKSASKSKSKTAKAAQNQSQSSATAPESARRAAALASINAASQRRGGQTNAGPVMVAGKGREVTITPSSTPLCLMVLSKSNWANRLNKALNMSRRTRRKSQEAGERGIKERISKRKE